MQRKVKHVIKSMPPRMKEKLEKARLAQEVNEKIRLGRMKRTKFHSSNSTPVILPEDFTGRDLKRAIKLVKEMKRREKRQKKDGNH
jgi:hypothetical protein